MKNSVAERLLKLGVRDVDLEESFARSGGPGGQNVNKVATAVTLRHRPSGVSVTVQDSRSQAINRKLARERLLDAIEHRQRAARRAQIIVSYPLSTIRRAIGAPWLPSPTNPTRVTPAAP